MGIDKSMALNGKYKLNEHVRFDFDFPTTVRNNNYFSKEFHIIVILYSNENGIIEYPYMFETHPTITICLRTTFTPYMTEQFKFIDKNFTYDLPYIYLKKELPEHFINIVRNMIWQKLKYYKRKRKSEW